MIQDNTAMSHTIIPTIMCWPPMSKEVGRITLTYTVSIHSRWAEMIIHGDFFKVSRQHLYLTLSEDNKTSLGEMEPLWEGWREECSLQSSDQVPLLYSCREQPLKPMCYKTSPSPGPCHAAQDASPIQGCLLLKQTISFRRHSEP